MSCDGCGSVLIGTSDVRKSPGGRVRRRRECLDCGVRWTTYEVAAGELARLEDLSGRWLELIQGLEVG